MKELQLIDRVVVEIKSEDTQKVSNEWIARQLEMVAQRIRDCYKGGTSDWEGNDIPENTELLWEHECPNYGGFRMGDKSLISMHYYGSEKKPRIIKDDEFVVCYLTKSDIEQQHFDPSGIDDDTMESIASRMNEYLCEGVGYWDALDAACEFYDIPRKEDEDEDQQ